MSGRLQIQLTATAEATYAAWCDGARSCASDGDGCNPKVKAFHALDEALTKVIPENPFNQKLALSGALSLIFRFTRDGLTICYIGHEQLQRIIVLYICESRPDTIDSYATFAYMVMSGKFDSAFASLGLRPPDRQGSLSTPTIH